VGTQKLDLKIKLIEIDHFLNLVPKLSTDRWKNTLSWSNLNQANFGFEVKSHQEADTSLQSGS
jgi:hypothetical protein